MKTSLKHICTFSNAPCWWIRTRSKYKCELFLRRRFCPTHTTHSITPQETPSHESGRDEDGSNESRPGTSREADLLLCLWADIRGVTCRFQTNAVLSYRWGSRRRRLQHNGLFVPAIPAWLSTRLLFSFSCCSRGSFSTRSLSSSPDSIGQTGTKILQMKPCVSAPPL